MEKKVPFLCRCCCVSKCKEPVKKEGKKFKEAHKILMSQGFGITLLNVLFGFLPISIRSSSMAYSKCSVIQLYCIVLFLTLIFATLIFGTRDVLFNLYSDLNNRPENISKPIPITYILAVSMNMIAQCLGFLAMMFRGQLIGSSIPEVWMLVTKAVDSSVIKLKGTNYKSLDSLKKYCCKLYWTYVLALILNETALWYDPYLPIDRKGRFEYLLYMSSYVFWDFTTVSHVLTCTFLGFLVKSLEVCLKAINNSLSELVEDIEFKSFSPPTIEEVQRMVAQNNGVDTIAQRLGFRNTEAPNPKRVLRVVPREEEFVEKLDQIKTSFANVENAVERISSVFGVSIFIEVLILFGVLLGNSFFVFISYTNLFEDSTLVEDEPWLEAAGHIKCACDIVVHFTFFYQLALAATKLKTEAKRSTKIVRELPYHKYPENLQSKLEMLRQDLKAKEMNLTAAEYFTVNKNFITTLLSGVLTFLVVLIQFEATDFQNQPVSIVNILKRADRSRHQQV